MKRPSSSVEARPKLSRNLAILGLLILGAVVHKLFNDTWIAGPAEQGHYQANARLLIQQVDRLSTLYLIKMPAVADLSPADRERLETWLVFDKQFMDINKDDSSTLFEVATAARRIGFASLVLGRTVDAKQYLSEAEARLSSLVHQYPTDLSYRLEYAGTLLQQAQLNERTGDQSQAKSKCAAALEALARETSPYGDDYAVSIAQLLVAIVGQLVQLNEQKLASGLLMEASQLLENQMDKQNPSPQIPILLEQCRAFSAKLE